MKIRILLPLIFFLSFTTLAQDVALPKLTKRVTDLTGTLSSAEQNSLEQKLINYESEKGSQLVVVLIPTTGDETIEQYSIRLAEDWKIGRGGVDDGIIMLFAMTDRKMRIEVGYALEGALTDALSKRIITNIITPEFRSGHFYKGIESGVDVVISAVSGEELPPVVKTGNSRSVSRSSKSLVMPLLIIGFIFAGFVKSILTKKLGKGKATGISAVIVFVLGWFFIGLVAAIFISAIVAIFISVPSNGGRGGGGGMYWGGGFGSGGGYSGGGGGFGGFSGGGGGFGGGGASGGW